MRIVSFNINGVRARPHQLQALKDTIDPDIIGLQETKVQDPDFPLEMMQDLGYHTEFFGQKAHYGVALLSKKAPLRVTRGYASDDDEAQKRLITATYESASGNEITVINGYFPQGESRDHETKFPNKRKFYADLMTHLEQFTPDDNLAVIGDVNIARIDADIGIGADNAKRWLRTGKCSFLPEEREWMERLMAWGLDDTFRIKYPDVDDRFSWFDYRSKGFDREPRRGLRIDLILATPALNSKLTDAGISYDLRAMEKPSDHCPIWADFDI
ncbi:exodeoxyribonuclease III [Solemya velum gill symbiont]|uniref:Exodeoxyribonuclease III n=2 Tax=Solemya velum gill symbiont TaxID=2340 RepID=A0A0B0H7E5_SOVGS|nr:exodeoxyribonuclease III [Solemya velum gill symbiont]KHF24582.1 exodeoxyribonuclease III [Solemya velum gill symbiont]OOY34660.1 exodeoxyribonuclease III [Solemya velum gill symbiont]OOY37454.1 exodeoxyribonuclease III [Solemya velum gill symbiont]OOY47643.1 exodeoxyribonuclease III [Solemya velum gill symbiont]OOY50971.1 exodeoxyribonuclease III [Solemya velum gill symbiont]